MKDFARLPIRKEATETPVHISSISMKRLKKGRFKQIPIAQLNANIISTASIAIIASAQNLLGITVKGKISKALVTTYINPVYTAEVRAFGLFSARCA